MRTPSIHRFALSALALASFPLATHADVLVVDASAGPYFAIDAAITAASEGDVVLVKTGSYGGFTVSAKSVAVIADAGATVNVGGGISVSGLTSAQQVTLSGLHDELGFAAQAQLQITACAGSVRVLDCAFGASFGPLGGLAAPAAIVASSQDVALSGCTLRANYDAFTFAGGEGLRVQSSRVSISRTTIQGGAGAPGTSSGSTGLPNTSGHTGADGVVCRNSTLFLAGASVTGGPGGSGLGGSCATPYDYPTGGGGGGAGLRVMDLSGTPSKVTVLDSSLQGGVGGPGGRGNCATAPDGPAGNASEGATPAIVGALQRTLSAIAPAREGSTLDVHFEGAPGDRVYLALGNDPSFEIDRALHGVVLIQTPVLRRYVGTIGASGTLDAHLPVGELGVGVQARLRHAQAFFVDTSRTGWVSGPAVALLLDAAF